MAKLCTWMIVFFIVGATATVENYMDYGNDASGNDKTANLRELYRFLVQRSADEPEGFPDLASEHLQPRAVERSPSLRLRFGRSYPKYPRSPSLRLRFGRSYSNPVGPLSKLNEGGSSYTGFEEN
ncbi:PREDICTED: uncharacterized protein LOC105360971 [Ceratosolen solmsi marchali]|uniref:Uncharacterized protein LOC105360971 n=1 Tax=Ceratosolen solmsi marchali TaxID=326594 RepID=A0AAJ6YE05_9HYME|nr:PREDICTED: uncharacterized protein LOC105360971 [Ceratosolen solmsi marchali]